jgi:hypothetical protein
LKCLCPFKRQRPALSESETQRNGFLGISRFIDKKRYLSISPLIDNAAAISLLKERISAMHGLPVRILTLRVNEGVG